MRGRLGLKPVEVVSVDLVKAEDGLPISSTRIKAGEIDAAGKRIGAKSRKA
jgi:pantetheine-phosphate adenylyltransferase